eukprot:TRINITY_DN51817_c0_g1_i1.p1 TRINITY_DN51817_c0_g1~~TRINITY_DN51817_c0_g1_i1.p1  ORF type:complete len:598 (+),score=163.42 TRINITY_DN51817_c0_g1_i1:74-1795(+)
MEAFAAAGPPTALTPVQLAAPPAATATLAEASSSSRCNLRRSCASQPTGSERPAETSFSQRCAIAALAAGVGGLAAAASSRRKSRSSAGGLSKRPAAVVRHAMGEASPAEAMTELLQRWVPQFLEVVQVADSREGEGLGLYSTMPLKEDEVIFAWEIGSPALMLPEDAVADKLELGNYGALAFQVLRQMRKQGDKRPAFAEWVDAGAQAPETHPLKLLFEDPGMAKKIWTATTCGGRMTATALQMRDDLERLGGSGATAEEWAEAVALVMSRSICDDDRNRPMLAIGLDLLQDGGDPNVEIVLKFEDLGWGMEGDRDLLGIELRALRVIDEGEELRCHYFSKPCAGKYIERYGFIPQRLLGEVGITAGCVELTFDGTDEDEDEQYYQRESILENLGFSPESESFFFDNDTGYGVADTTRAPYELLDPVSQLVWFLRFRNISGKDAFLLDAVYADSVWGFCNDFVSKENEISVAQGVLDECDRWLARFAEADKQASDPDSPYASSALAKGLSSVRLTESDLLLRLRTQFMEALRDAEMATNRMYWADREMLKVFPAKKYQTPATAVDPEFQDQD